METYFTEAMELAEEACSHGEDPDEKVGAVIVDVNLFGKISVIGKGWNRAPKGFEKIMPWNSKGDLIKTKHPYVVHAEPSALKNANEYMMKNLNGYAENNKKKFILFVTEFPCNQCAKQIIESEIISSIVYKNDALDSHWTIQSAKTMLEECGIKYKQFKNITN